MKIFAYHSKNDERMDSVLSFVVAEDIDAAQAIIEGYYYPTRMGGHLKRWYRLSEYAPQKPTLWIINQESQYDFNTRQGPNTVGLALVNKIAHRGWVEGERGPCADCEGE